MICLLNSRENDSMKFEHNTKKMQFSRFSMFDQIQIINYFKFVNQSNFISTKIRRFESLFFAKHFII